jgi:hypothetical protein
MQNGSNHLHPNMSPSLHKGKHCYSTMFGADFDSYMLFKCIKIVKFAFFLIINVFVRWLMKAMQKIFFILFPQYTILFPQLIILFPQYNILFPQLIILFPQYNILFSQLIILFPQERYVVPTTYYFVPTTLLSCSLNILFCSHNKHVSYCSLNILLLILISYPPQQRPPIL